MKANTAAASRIDETPMQKFEGELQARYPGRVIQRFEMPSNVKQCRAIYLMEITSRDEIQASIFADSVMTPLEKGSIKLSSEAERRECTRASLVAIVSRSEPITYRHVNHDGIPLLEIDQWPSKAWTALQTYFNEVNGVPSKELLEGLKGARTIGAFDPPTSEIQPHASIVK